MNPQSTSYTKLSTSAIMRKSEEKKFCYDILTVNEEAHSFKKTILPCLKQIIKSYANYAFGNYTKKLFILNDLRNSIPYITAKSMTKVIEYVNKLK